ncbi:MAG: hypothetical protein ABFD18_04945 [Syntrophomonas sp.]
MQDLCWDCRTCEACGVCGRSEAECSVYHEYYEIGKRPNRGEYSSNAIGVLKESKIAKQTQGPIEANMGLVNRLSGRIVSIIEGDETAILTIKAGEKKVSSMMPLSKLRESGKSEGDIATLVFKASNVKLMK